MAVFVDCRELKIAVFSCINLFQSKFDETRGVMDSYGTGYNRPGLSLEWSIVYAANLIILSDFEFA